MDMLLDDIAFERQSPLQKALRRVLFNPLANYLPAGLMRGLLKFGKSQLAAANWKEPGGWRSMVISYNGHPVKMADRILVGAGTMSKALRNRRKLAACLLVRQIEACPRKPVHVLCLGAGPGHIISDAMVQAEGESFATLVDLNNDAFDYGRELASKLSLSGRIRFIVGDARDIEQMLDRPVDIVKMLGLCEYLSDEQIVAIASSVAAVMQKGAPVLVNSISKAHGTDRFFRKVFGLNMTHRSPAQLEQLLQKAGFGDFETAAEPLGVYHVMVGRRR